MDVQIVVRGPNANRIIVGALIKEALEEHCISYWIRYNDDDRMTKGKRDVEIIEEEVCLTYP